VIRDQGDLVRLGDSRLAQLFAGQQPRKGRLWRYSIEDDGYAPYYPPMASEQWFLTYERD
jgi:hypothetical protein